MKINVSTQVMLREDYSHGVVHLRPAEPTDIAAMFCAASSDEQAQILAKILDLARSQIGTPRLIQWSWIFKDGDCGKKAKELMKEWGEYASD